MKLKINNNKIKITKLIKKYNNNKKNKNNKKIK